MGQSVNTGEGDVNFSITDVEGNSSLFQNRLRTLLIQCPCCSMYALPDNTHNYLHNQYLNGFPLSEMLVCRKCCIISEQKGAIDFLNGQIHDLVTTVEKLRDIRCIEKEIDASLSYLGPHVGNATFAKHDYRDRTVCSSQSSTDDNLEHPIPDETISVSATDGESLNLNSISKDEVDDIVEQLSRMIVSDKTDANRGTNCEEGTSTHFENTSHSEDNNEEDGDDLSDYTIIDETLPSTETATSEISSTGLSDISSAYSGTCISNQNKYSSPLITSVIPTFNDIILDSDAHSMLLSSAITNNDDCVETLVIGDGNVKNIKIHEGSASRGIHKTYKVLKASSSISEIAATTEYLLRRRFKNVKQVILHIGTNNAKIIGSEEIRSLKNFCEIVTNRFEKQLIISGPILTMSMNSESFSRAFAINTWLANATIHREIKVCFVDNFHLFWGKEHLLFQRDHKTLNLLGAAFLSSNILCNIDCAI